MCCLRPAMPKTERPERQDEAGDADQPLQILPWARSAALGRFPKRSEHGAAAPGGIAPEFRGARTRPYLRTAAGGRSTRRFCRRGWCSGCWALRAAGTRRRRCTSPTCRSGIGPAACPCASRWGCPEAARKGSLQGRRTRRPNSARAPKCLKSLHLGGISTCPRDGVTAMR